MIYIATIIYTLLLGFLFEKSGGCYIYQNNSKHRLFEINIQKLKYNIFLFICMLPSILVSGFRYGISVDYLKIYIPSFNYIKTVPFKNLGLNEIAYKIIAKFCGLLCEEPWLFFLCTSAIIISLFYLNMRNNSQYFLLSILLFFGTGIYFDSFNGLRQYLAVAIFAYSYKFIKERNIKRFLVSVVLATSFHTSAIFLIPVFWLSKIQIKSKYWIIIFTCIFLFRSQIVDLFIYILSLFSKYNEYIIKNTLNNYTNLSMSDLLSFVIVLIPCILYEKEMLNTEEGKFLFNMTMVGFSISMISGVLPLAYRIIYYFKITYLLSIPFVLKIIKQKRKRLIMGATICSLLCGMNIIGIIVLNWYAVLPYESIFDLRW